MFKLEKVLEQANTKIIERDGSFITSMPERIRILEKKMSMMLER